MSIVEKSAKYLLLGLTGVTAAGFIGSFFVADETVKRFAGPLGPFVVDTRTELSNVAQDRASSIVFWARTTFNDLTDFSSDRGVPRVVMQIPPPPTTLDQDATPQRPQAAVAEDQPSLNSNAQANPPENEPSDEAAGSEDAETPTQEPPPMAGEMPSSGAPAAPRMEDTPGDETSALARPVVVDPDPAPVPDAVPVEAVAEVPINAPSTLETSDTPPSVIDAEAANLLAELDDGGAPDTELAALPGAEADGPPTAPDAIEDANPGLADYQEGLRFYNGDGVERNFGRAAQAFLRAAEAGHIGAQYNLGIMNYVGQTGGQDFANAAKWFERAAAQDHAQAQYNLGFLYYEGKGVAQDLRTAFDWINRSAEHGYEKAIRARDQFRQIMPDMFEQAPAS